MENFVAIIMFSVRVQNMELMMEPPRQAEGSLQSASEPANADNRANTGEQESGRLGDIGFQVGMPEKDDRREPGADGDKAEELGSAGGREGHCLRLPGENPARGIDIRVENCDGCPQGDLPLLGRGPAKDHPAPVRPPDRTTRCNSGRQSSLRWSG